ncbi:hypothetical protein A6768_13195 [Sphingobium yanoikuyae]|uniref:asparagine synthase (glutamine-hydrolyzing) n=2 Tax=Sphingobium yanoikuyae TaxID=13690 RepID=A0A291N107_SPHYA|nr:hypothetical protein A6768_13195 [Sphingobium yanoikuyae]
MTVGRYLVVLGRSEGNARDRLLIGARHALPRLNIVMDGAYCTVLADALLPRARFGEGRGCILGRLHGPDEAAFLTTGGRPSSAADWQAVTRDNWGDYLLIEESRGAPVVDIVRSAMGGLSCYHVSHAGLFLLSDAPRLLERLGINLAIDADAVLRQMLSNVSRGPATCLAGLGELERGYRLSWREGVVETEPYWNPWSYAGRAGQMKDLADAPVLVRKRVIEATRRTAKGYGHILLGLSGGLDSSILAASLAHTGAAFSCFTLVTHDGPGDERYHARLVARHLGKHLHEIEERPGDIDIARSAAAHLPRPVARCFAQSDDAIQMALASRLGVDALMSGGGGDNIFYYVHSVRPLVDRLLVEGLGKGAWRTARDLALLTDSPLGAIIGRALGRCLSRSHDYLWTLDTRYLRAEACTIRREALGHGWMKAPAGELPGKAQHIAWILGVLNHVEGFAREQVYPTLWPLLAQPLVETCLSVPSWAWLEGGHNRALARRAFAGLLPEPILARRSKGSPDSFAIGLFEQRKAQIERHLCDGWLAAQGLVDVDAIARGCRQGPVHKDGTVWSLLRLVDAESWARSWA